MSAVMNPSDRLGSGYGGNAMDGPADKGLSTVIAHIEALERKIESVHSQQSRDIAEVRAKLDEAERKSEGWQWTSVGLGVISAALGTYAVVPRQYEWWWTGAMALGILSGWSLILFGSLQMIRRR